MKAKTAKRRVRPCARSFIDCLREFLTPSVWKQANSVRMSQRRSSRWNTQPLVLVLQLMTWCCGDSQPERFETAKAFCVVCMPKRRRPGQTVQGFQKALARLPLQVLWVIARSIRKLLAVRLASRWFDHGFIAMGCDGSRVECPRSKELEGRLGLAGKEGSAPEIWLTALVHLRLGVPWGWRIGKGTASERSHLLQMLALLPKAALLVADAGYFGFDLARRLVDANVQFLLRMSSNVTLYTKENVVVDRFREGEVYYFPAKKGKQKKPLCLRLIRVRGKKPKGKKRPNDVWLLTNVVDSKRLSPETAATFYRWRWESEGQFRAYKRTLSKVKMVSRTVRLVHREAEGAMLALQLMLAQGALAMPKQKTKDGSEAVCSPRKVLLAIRQELYGLVGRGEPKFYARLQQAQRERRRRTTAKAIRSWPRRKPHKAPKPPRLLTLTDEQKALIAEGKRAAA